MPPVSRCEQLADQLRERIFAEEWDPGSKLPSGPELSRTHAVSQPVAQRAFEVLAREGLVRMVAGSGTVVLPRKAWHVEFGVRSADVSAVAEVTDALARAAQPTVREATARCAGDGVVPAMTVESADLGGAVAAALGMARRVLSAFPVATMSATEVYGVD
jgi:DNA-binding FadR family transcriptional regulator